MVKTFGVNSLGVTQHSSGKNNRLHGYDPLITPARVQEEFPAVDSLPSMRFTQNYHRLPNAWRLPWPPDVAFATSSLERTTGFL